MLSFKLNTCQLLLNKKCVSVTVCVCVCACACVCVCDTLLWSSFLFPIFLSCFTGALRHRHSDTLCWEGHLEHPWAGDTWLKRLFSTWRYPWSPTGRNHPLGAWWYGSRKSCTWLVWSGLREDVKYWPLTQRKPRPPSLFFQQMSLSFCCQSYCMTVCTLTWFFSYMGVTLTGSWCVQNNLKIWLSHQMLK